MTWVYSVPVWLVCLLFIGGASALAAGGLYVVRGRAGGERYADNDVAGPIMGTLGTLLAVMLSFMVVTVWQEYDQSAAIVQTEVNQIGNLYDEVGAFPQPESGRIRHLIREYVNIVVTQEWPLMRAGGRSPQAHRIAAQIVDLVQSYSPTNAAMQNAQADALGHAHNFIDARAERLFQNQQAVPPLLWLVMIFLAAVTLGSAYFFAVPNLRTHVMLTVAVGAVIGSIFVVIAEFDLPFRGDLQIQPTAFSQDYRLFADPQTYS